jgi:hypothetical protein
MCWYTPIDFKPYTRVIFIKEHIEFQVSERDVRQSLWCFGIQSSSYVVMGNASHPDTLEVTGWDLSPHGSCLGMCWLDMFQKLPFASKWYQLSIYIAPFDSNLGLSDVSRKSLHYCHGRPDTVDTSTIVWSMGMTCRYPHDWSWVIGEGLAP